MKVLSYEMAGALDLISDDEGNAIFPISSDAELAMLTAIADLHGVAIHRRTAFNSSEGSQMCFRTGVVGALSALAKPAAALYAHLTKRHCPKLMSLAEVASCVDLSVLVVTASEITFELMDLLYGTGLTNRSSAPGLIVAQNIDCLPMSVKRSAAALSASPGKQGETILVFSTQDFDEIHHGDVRFLGADAENQKLRAAGRAGAAILSVHGHGSGLDFSLGPKLYVCPLELNGVAHDGPRPLCHITQKCTRIYNLPTIAAALSNESLMPLTEIRTQILQLFTCQTLRLNDGVLSSDFNLGALLGWKPTIGCAVVSWKREMTWPDHTTVNPLLNRLRAGERAGDALKKYNETSAVIETGIKLCLLGDPDYAIAADRSLVPLPVGQPPRDSPAAKQRKNHLKFAKLTIMRMINRVAQQKSSQSVEPGNLDERLELLLTSILTNTDGAMSEEFRAEVNMDLASSISSYPWIDELVSPFGEIGPIEAPLVCKFCGRHARAFTFCFHLSAVPNWKVVSCPACATETYGPLSMHDMVCFSDIEDGRLTVRGASRFTRAMITFDSPSTNSHRSAPDFRARLRVPWPTDHAGKAKPDFKVPQEILPFGYLRCYIHLVNELDIASWSWTMRGAQPPS